MELPWEEATSTAYKDLVWTVATATDEDLDLIAQTSQALNMIQHSLSELGTDKSRILSAQVFLANIEDKPDHGFGMEYMDW